MQQGALDSNMRVAAVVSMLTLAMSPYVAAAQATPPPGEQRPVVCAVFYADNDALNHLAEVAARSLEGLVTTRTPGAAGFTLDGRDAAVQRFLQNEAACQVALGAKRFELKVRPLKGGYALSVAQVGAPHLRVVRVDRQNPIKFARSRLPRYVLDVPTNSLTEGQLLDLAIQMDAQEAANRIIAGDRAWQSHHLGG